MEEKKPDLRGMPISTLYAIQQEAKSELDACKAWADNIQLEINTRIGQSAVNSLADLGKQYGTVNLPCQDGIVAKCVIDKKVEWDSDKLFSVAMSLPMDQARNLMKFAISIPEKNWEGIQHANPALAERLKDARTTKFGAPKVTLLKEA